MINKTTMIYWLVMCAIALGITHVMIKIFRTRVGMRATDPPLYPSLTILGPLQLFKNPLELAEKARKELKSDIFSCWMMGKKITFVFGKDNIGRFMDAQNNELNFEDGYVTFLRLGFGDGILTRRTAPAQVGGLKKYLGDEYVKTYLKPTQELATRLITESLGESGEIELQKVLLKTSFSVGARNFLGEDFLDTLPHYDYDGVSSGFEMGLEFIAQYLPIVGKFLSWFDQYRKPTPFAKSVFDLTEKKLKDLPPEPRNMFEEVISRREEKDGPSQGTRRIFANLMRTLVFAGGFNGYNMLSYFLRDTLKNQELWKKLREEQIQLDQLYGIEPTNEKRSQMRILYKVLMTEMFKKTFPFLLRYVDVPYTIGGYVVPKDHIVACSPQIEHNGQDYIDDAQFNLIFGKGVHACPARKYALNSMMLILRALITQYDFELIEAKPMVNTRLVTFPTQPPIWVRYRRIIQ